ncbi:unnamed protein product [Rotaria sp. Silwood2]|nr:unnamed protein product [Rotaria sp. Silwood2]
MKEIPLSLWNAHGPQHRTNNICDSFHNRLNHRIEKSHPNIWSFIKCLQDEESRFRQMLIQVNAGAKRRPKATATTAIQQRIDTSNERYSNSEIDLQVLFHSLSTVVAKQHK